MNIFLIIWHLWLRCFRNLRTDEDADVALLRRGRRSGVRLGGGGQGGQQAADRQHGLQSRRSTGHTVLGDPHRQETTHDQRQFGRRCSSTMAVRRSVTPGIADDRLSQMVVVVMMVMVRNGKEPRNFQGPGRGTRRWCSRSHVGLLSWRDFGDKRNPLSKECDQRCRLTKLFLLQTRCSEFCEEKYVRNALYHWLRGSDFQGRFDAIFKANYSDQRDKIARSESYVTLQISCPVAGFA